MPDRTVGRVTGLWRYPVKSMAGEALRDTAVSWHGVPGDRRWAFVRPEMQGSGFPWLTLRQRADMWRYRPSLGEPENPDTSPVFVLTPDGDRIVVTDSVLATELGDGVRVMKQDRGIFDAMPLSLISSQSVVALGAACGRALEVQRFRPNILVEAGSGQPFEEDTWVGRVLRLGDARIRVDRRDERCVIVNIDPRTTDRDASVLRTVAHARGACAGVYGSTVAPGSVAVGDAVVIEEG